MDIDDLLSRTEAVLRRKNISKVAYGEALNSFLPKRLQKPITRSRSVTIYRWFSTEQNKRKPSADVALAMSEWLKKNEE